MAPKDALPFWESAVLTRYLFLLKTSITEGACLPARIFREGELYAENITQCGGDSTNKSILLHCETNYSQEIPNADERCDLVVLFLEVSHMYLQLYAAYNFK